MKPKVYSLALLKYNLNIILKITLLGKDFITWIHIIWTGTSFNLRITSFKPYQYSLNF